MSPADIEVFLKAKRQILWVQRAQAIIAIVTVVGLGVAILALGLGDGPAINLFAGFVLGAAVYTFGERASGPRDRLIELVERQINRDPAALRYLSGVDPAR